MTGMPSPPAFPGPRLPEALPPPLLTKAVLSMIFGFLSIPGCMCFAVPSLVFGGVAIWLGVWVQKNYRGNTASEFANLYAWVGIIFGSLGILLGLVGIMMMIAGGAASILNAAKSATP